MNGRFSLFSKLSVAFLCSAGLIALNGCQQETPAPAKGGPAITAKAPGEGKEHDHDHDHEHGKEGHHHHHHADKGPHKGTLIELGEEAAHLELVLDAETGKLTVYVLDGEAKDAVFVKQRELELAYAAELSDEDKKKGELPEPEILKLKGGEKSEGGEVADFSGEFEKLKGVKEFHVVLTAITVGDKEYKNVEVKYPEGNEHHHHH